MAIIESIQTAVCIICGVALVLLEVGYLITGTEKGGKLWDDFTNGKYYKPWGNTWGSLARPVVINPSKRAMTELSEAKALSQRAVYADIFGFQHTMNGISRTEQENNLLRTRLYSRLLQVRGPANLKVIYPALQKQLGSVLLQQLEKGKLKIDGSISIRLAPTIRTISSRLMAQLFFGENAAADEAFAESLLTYSADMVRCMAVFQFFPRFLTKYVHILITRNGRAMHFLQSRFKKMISDNDGDMNNTILHDMVQLTHEQNSQYWTVHVISQSLLGIWFAASHQPWMNLDFVLLELAQRPEWQVQLREEIGDHSRLDYQTLDNLPYLDSFIKETVRMNPLDNYAIRRKALQTYHFANGGWLIKTGVVACVSAIDILRNKEAYPDPDEWRGDRFVTTPAAVQGSKFSDVSEYFPTWGFGALACPGRFHAALVMKIILAHIVSHYEVTLESKGRTKFMWESFTLPYDSTRVSLKKVN
ncbi:7-alpha-hydroxycholest-4-en-3-one 12-alpha-hydroxylase [Talaromyces islandicus]|uniref:7-alpha-hydroxycholest-4-en-3-one 12-alpha-hydroxylase n=1 Tax=Talaromyces islandicus TaxID=28573 RepID=A0A0U1M5C0_TALIS|nr:7-alpha-hydroxycholest-4-en-3-one 12-alpha-hydroxylase [Talaromyces islandicus]